MKLMRRWRAGPGPGDERGLAAGGTMPDFADLQKLSALNMQAVKGVRNYLLFQRFPSYKWPFWVPRQQESRDLAVGSPVLLNRSARDWICFSNQYSRELLRIDPSGMLSCAGERWSIEFWWMNGDSILRPQNMDGVFERARDPETSLVTLRWKCSPLDMGQTLYGIMGASDDVLVRTDFHAARHAGDSALLAVVRPYSNEEIGGLDSLEYRRDTKSIRVQGADRILVDVKPDFILAGNGTAGDVAHPAGERETLKASCRYGMATIALGFRIKKGARFFHLRIGLAPARNISSARLNLEQASKEYADSSRNRLASGTRLTFPDGESSMWFATCKSAMLHHAPRIASASPRESDLQQIVQGYYVCSSCARSGFVAEAMKIALLYLKGYSYPEQRGLRDHLSAAYVVSMFADFFLFSRDNDALREHYPSVKKLTDLIAGFSSGVRMIESASSENFIDGLHLGIAHAHDYAVLMNAMRQASYLARCAGIFGDETRFGAEVERLKGVILKWCAAALAGGETVIPPEFAAYCVTAGWPHGQNVLTPDDFRSLVKLVADSLPTLPVYNASCGGWDSFVSLALASNMLLVKDDRCFQIFEKLVSAAGDARVFVDFLSPSTMRGVYGEGDSARVIWAMGAFLRNAMFVDYEHRLEVLPVPRPEWFEQGRELVIHNAPSRFGTISIRILSLAHEIQYHFTDLPKFVPPEIMINLPFKAKIKPESDFILKKEVANSYIINGWPSIVRFAR